MHHQNRLCAGGDGPLHSLWVEVQRHRVNLSKDRRGARQQHGIGHRDECERGHNDLIARSDIEREQGKVQARRSGTDRDGMIHAVIGGESFFECAEFRTETEVWRAQDAGDGLDLLVGDVGSRQRNLHRHCDSCVAATGVGCLMSRPSKGTVVSTCAIFSAAVPLP